MENADEAAGAGLTEEHHSWIEQFCGTSARPAAAASSPAPATEPAKEEDSGGLFGALSSAVTAVGDAASSVVHGAVDVAEKAVDTVADAAGAVVHGVAEVGAKAAEAVVSAVPLPDSVKSAATDYIEFQKGVVEGAADGVTSLVKGVTHLAGSVAEEGYDLMTSEKAREEALTTVAHGAEAVGGFVKEAVTDPGKAWDDTKAAVEGAAGKVLQIGKALYHSYEEAKAAGHGAEWLGKGVGQVGVAVAGAVLTDGASLAGEGAAVGVEAVTEGTALLEGAEALDAGASALRVAEEGQKGVQLAGDAEELEQGAAAGTKLEEAEQASATRGGGEVKGGGEPEVADPGGPPSDPPPGGGDGGGGGTTKAYRVEGKGNERVLIDEDGNVTIPEVRASNGAERNLYVNFGDEARAQKFLRQRLKQFPDNEIKSFDVPNDFVEELRQNAVSEAKRAGNPGRPVIADPTKAADQFGLPESWIQMLRERLIQGSGKIGS